MFILLCARKGEWITETSCRLPSLSPQAPSILLHCCHSFWKGACLLSCGRNFSPHPSPLMSCCVKIVALYGTAHSIYIPTDLPILGRLLPVAMLSPNLLLSSSPSLSPSFPPPLLPCFPSSLPPLAILVEELDQLREDVVFGGVGPYHVQVLVLRFHVPADASREHVPTQAKGSGREGRRERGRVGRKVGEHRD